MGSNMNPMV